MTPKSVGTREPNEGPPVNTTEPNGTDPNTRPDSADRFSESANRMVNTGLMLRRRRVQPLVTGTDGVGLHRVHTSLRKVETVNCGL